MDIEATGTVYHEYLEVDNAALFTVICLPQSGSKFPTVIMRSPYVDDYEQRSEAEICEKKLLEHQKWLDHGFAVVFQHCRGRGKSSGGCVPYIYEREDGLFLQEWIRKQPFYNGELYLYGGSYTASVHFVTAPFAPDIKGAVLEVQDCERYNCNYRNGFYKMGLHGGWYVGMYKKKSGLKKSFTAASYNMLPLSDFSKTVLGEEAPDFDAILQHPDREDPFWQTRYGGGEAHDAVKHTNIPILFVTGFYDIYTGGVFDMWKGLDEETRRQSALAVHPFEHSGSGAKQPICFENGALKEAFQGYAVNWLRWVRGGGEPPSRPARSPTTSCLTTGGVQILSTIPTGPLRCPWEQVTRPTATTPITPPAFPAACPPILAATHGRIRRTPGTISSASTPQSLRKIPL